MKPRAVIITGASSGIGEATARLLAASSRLLLVARRRERLETLAGRLREQGAEVVVHAADLADPAQVTGVVEAALAAFGEVECLINNAGIFRVAAAAAIDAAHLAEQWAINVQAPMLLTAAALPALRRSRGLVINVSSMVVENRFPGTAAYTACKAALEAWSGILREEEREHGVRVGLVAPGATDTEVFGDLPFDHSTMMQPADIARSILHLLDCPPSASIERISLMPPAGSL
jgi:NADP-dependent 3-hydroxy acid dehydrogenase YdfG